MQRRRLARITRLNDTNVSYVLPPGNISAPVTLLVGLFSTWPASRAFVRQSWARALASDIRLWFLASVPSTGSPDIWLERRRHADLLLFDEMREAYSLAGVYSSLPLKSLTLYDAATRHASFAFLLKTDDDVYVNLPGVRAVLALAPRERCYAGYVYRNIHPDRRHWSKYRDRVWRANATSGMVHLARMVQRARNGSAADRASVAAWDSALSNEAEPPYADYADGIGELLSSDVAGCISRLLPTYVVPSPIADVVTGHAVRQCRVRARSQLPATQAQLGLWNATLREEQLIFVWHAGRSIAVEPFRRNRIRFVLLPH